jgi:hypothetical protein
VGGNFAKSQKHQKIISLFALVTFLMVNGDGNVTREGFPIDIETTPSHACFSYLSSYLVDRNILKVIKPFKNILSLHEMD